MNFAKMQVFLFFTNHFKSVATRTADPSLAPVDRAAWWPGNGNAQEDAYGCEPGCQE